MSPLEAHNQNIAARSFQHDDAQMAAAGELDRVYHRLILGKAESAMSRLWRRIRRQPAAMPKGLYLWGGVGRGKTYLMDLFFECLPFQSKHRMHFHRFMLRVHAELNELEGVANPMLTVADRLAAEATVLCFDELFVSDIADAMLLGELLGALLDRGVTLVATSNVEPARLYENGLQRRRFLPTIERLTEHMKVQHLADGVDYRLRVLTRANIYHWPSSDETDASLEECFVALAPELPSVNEVIEVNGRNIQTRRRADDVVWFDFREICDGPRSQNDYVELSREFHAVIISDVPRLDGKREDQARRFISLVDEFYDRNVKVILSAAADVEDLYHGGRLHLEFERTQSRLREMQSVEYLSRTHKP